MRTMVLSTVLEKLQSVSAETHGHNKGEREESHWKNKTKQNLAGSLRIMA